LEVDSHILSSLSVAAVKKSGGLEYLRQRGESSKVHISNADNNNNNPLGITFKIWNDQEN